MVKLERSGGDVGLVAELFRHAKYARLGAGANSVASMQGAVLGCDRGSQGFRDGANASRFAAFAPRCHVVSLSVSHIELPSAPAIILALS